MSDFAEIATVAVTSVMAVFLFVVITPLIYVCLKVSQLVVRISKLATCTSQLSYIQRKQLWNCILCLSCALEGTLSYRGLQDPKLQLCRAFCRYFAFLCNKNYSI